MSTIAMLTGAAATYAGKTAFKPLIEDVYSQMKKASGRKIMQWNTDAKIKQLYTKIAKVRKVKTLWQIDKPVDLQQFYCSSHAIVRKSRRQITSLDDLKMEEHILIQGIAGQGKSMLMRYLCSTELIRGRYVPVFVELRRLQDKRSLKDEIFAAFKALDLDVDEKLLSVLSKTGKLLLLLDGFDEIAETESQRVISELEDISLQLEGIKIVVSSRPDSGLEMSSHFQVVRLDDLKADEYKGVIYKLLNDLQTAEDIIDQIEAHQGLIRGCLLTPLMVTMLVIIYKSYAAIPAQFSEFYDSLFKVLLQRHDGAKPGYRRHRRCSINDTEYRAAFETLCLLSKGLKSSIFTETSLTKCAADALKKSRIREDEECFVEDIVKITCLIVRDGGQYRFLHKSVQEYYAASLLRRKPDGFIKAFYANMLSDKTVRGWRQELDFLSEIDKYRHDRYYLLPLISQLLGGNGESLPDVAPVGDLATVKRIVGGISLGFDINGRNPRPQVAYHPYTNELIERFITSFWAVDCQPVIDAIVSGKLKAGPFHHGGDKPGWIRVSIATIIDEGYLHQEFSTLVSKRLKEIHRQGQTILKTLEEEEDDKILHSLIEE